MPHVPNDPDVYEVFAQSGQGTALSHVGSIVSPRPDAAWHLAKETYGRRDDLARLWVVRRDDMIVSSADDRALLAAKTRMPHRQPGFPTARRRDRCAPIDAATTAGGGDNASGIAQPGLRDLWLVLADDLFVVGNHLGERIVDYIDLEESLAIGSIGQEALAHAATVLSLCGFEQFAADARFFDRPQEQWRVSRAVEQLTDWPSTVACGLVIAAAVTVLAEHIAQVESDAAWLPSITTIRDEQLIHLDHWRRWAQALARWPETRAQFERAYAEVTECAGDLFGVQPQDVVTAALHERLVAAVDEHGGPGSHLPRRPVARTAGLGGSLLADRLARGRLVREHYAPGVFS